MDWFQRRLRVLASSPAFVRRAMVVGCAFFLISWQLLPCSPSAQLVTIRLPVSTAPAAADGAGAESLSVRRFLVRAGSPQLERLKQLAAETQKTHTPRMPLAYYAEQWRITAAQYYYERDSQRDRERTAAGGEIGPAESETGSQAFRGEMTATEAAASTTIEAVSFESAPETPTDQFGASYWQRERSRAEARQRALLARLPASDAPGQGPRISFGKASPGRPQPGWMFAAATAAVLAGLGMWWLQTITVPPAPPAKVRPSMQLAVPGDWVRQSPSFGQRLVDGLAMAAWLGILGCSAITWWG